MIYDLPPKLWSPPAIIRPAPKRLWRPDSAMLPGIIPIPASSAAELSFLQSAVSATNATSYTFASQSLGAVHGERYIICALVADNGGTNVQISTCTIGGVSATVVREAVGWETASLVIAKVPTGTTGDVAVTWTVSSLRCGIGLWRAINLNTPTAHDTEIHQFADPLSVTINIPANGFVIASGYSRNSAAVAAYTGADENYDQTVETGAAHYGGSRSFSAAQTGHTVSVNLPNATSACMVAASFS